MTVTAAPKIAYLQAPRNWHATSQNGCVRWHRSVLVIFLFACPVARRLSVSISVLLRRRSLPAFPGSACIGSGATSGSCRTSIPTTTIEWPGMPSFPVFRFRRAPRIGPPGAQSALGGSVRGIYGPSTTCRWGAYPTRSDQTGKAACPLEDPSHAPLPQDPSGPCPCPCPCQAVASVHPGLVQESAWRLVAEPAWPVAEPARE